MIMDEEAPRTSETAKTIEQIDIHRIMRDIPHRYPFLMLDRVVDIVLNSSAVGVKNVTANENFFEGHFPNHPVMPGVLIIESMAQTAAVLVVETLGPDAAGKLVYFMSIEGAKFRRQVSPGDQLRLEVEVAGWRAVPRMIAAKMHGVAYVAGKKVAEATVSCQLIDSSRGRGDGSEGTAE